MIKDHEIDADEYWHWCRYLIIFAKIFFFDLFDFLHFVWIFKIILETDDITKQWHNLLSMRRSLNYLHDIVPRCIWKWIMNWLFGEINSLLFAGWIINFDVDQAIFKILKYFLILRSTVLKFIIVLVEAAFSSKLIIEFDEDDQDIKYSYHFILIVGTDDLMTIFINFLKGTFDII